MDTIFILNSHKQVIDVLSNNGSNPSAPFFDDTYKSELDTGAESYEFTTINNPRTNVTLEVGNYVLFKYNDKYKLFQIMETEDEHSEGKKLLTVYAEMAGMELLNDYCEPFSIEGNFIALLERALQDTNWRVGTYSASLLDNIQSVSYTEPKNVYSIIQENLATFGGVEIEFRVEFRNNQLAALLIDCYESGTRGNRKYRRFEYGKDVKGLTRNRNINDLATAVIGQGNNNVTFKDIEWNKNLGNPCDKPLQQDFVVDIEANDLWNNGGKYIKTVHKVDTDDPQTLLQECWDYLQEIKQPKFDYDVDLALVAEDYQDIGIGDTNYVLDFDYQPAILLEARVGTLELSFADPRNNKCTLTNYKELTSILQRPVDLNTVGNMIQSHFPIEGEDIAMGAIGEGHINVTYYQAIKTDIMSATLAEVGTLIADKADIKDLTAMNAQIENLQANKAEITELNAINGNVTNLTSQVGNIETLLAGNATAGNVQSIHLTSANAVIDDAVIKNAMIDTVSANKMNTGTLNTNNVVIESEDGGVRISGATQQFKDKEGHVRVQIGKDAQGNFTFCLFSQDGVGILLDETGIKAGAVPDGLIVNDMVADNANISGNKIDIASVITNINNNTTSIKSSAIKFDDTGQSLLVAFNQLKNQVDTIEEVTIGGDLSSVIEKVNTHTTQIGVMQGQISSLIENTTITKQDGTVVQLKDEYNNTVSTVNSNTTKIGTLESNYNKVTGDLESVTSRTTTLETNLSGVTARVSQTETDLNTTKSTIAEHSTTLEGITSQISSLETNYSKTLKTSSVQYYQSTSQTQLTGGSWKDTAPTWEQGKYMWQRMKYTYTDNSVTYGTASCVAGAKGDTGSQGMQGIQGEKGDTGAKGDIGDKGDKGDTGEKGQSLTSSIPQWYLSTSKTTQTGGSWVESMPALAEGKYIWLRYKLDWANPTATTYTTPTLEMVVEAVKTVSSKQTSLEQNLDGFKTTVSNTYATKSTVNDLSTNLSKNYSTTSQMNSAINQKANEITSSVSNTYTTKSDFNNLSIGGRNLLKNTSFFKNTTGWSASHSCNLKVQDTDTDSIGFKNLANKCVKVTSTSTFGFLTQSIELEKGMEYTASCWIYSSSTSARIGIFYENSGWIGITNKNITSEQLNKWTKLSVTFKANATYSKHYICFGISNGATGNIAYVTLPKLEKGNKATDWSPAPEDVDDKFTNYSTTEQMNSAITQKANQITSTVSSTYTTKSDFNNLTIGGGNLLKNTKTLDYVGGTATGRWIVDATGAEGFKKLAIDTTDASWVECQIPLYTEYNNLNQKVTISFQYYESISNLLAFNFSAHKADGSRARECENIEVKSTFKDLGKRDGWAYASYTFDPTPVNNQTDAIEYRAQFKKVGGKTGKIYIRKIKLELGDKATDWSPSSEDMATKSLVTQTANDVRFEFKHYGGTNLQYNGNGGASNLDGWFNWQTWWYKSNNVLGYVVDDGVETGCAQAPYTPCSANTTYSVKVHVCPEANTGDFWVTIKQLKSSDSSFFKYKDIWVNDTQKGWHTVRATFTTDAGIDGFYVELWNNKRKSTSESYVTFFSELMVIQGTDCYPDNYVPYIGSINSASTTINDNGVTINIDGGGSTNINTEGLTIYNDNGSKRAWFGQSNSAYIDTITTNKIIEPSLLRNSKGCGVYHLYCAPNATGDGTGRDSNNRANSIYNALEWFRSTYGTYLWQTDLYVHLANGDYWGASNYIGGWLGTGTIQVIFDEGACLRTSPVIEENTVTVYLMGGKNAWDYNTQNNAYIYVTSNNIVVRHSMAIFGGLNIQKEGWGGDLNTWTNYDSSCFCLDKGSVAYVANCDVIGYYNGFYLTDNSRISIVNCRGHNYRCGDARAGSLITYAGKCWKYAEGTYLGEGSQHFGGFSSLENSWFNPKPDAPYTPPAVTENWQWTENTFNATSLWTTPEGSGSGTTARNGCWGQGSWGSYKSHRGYASFDGINSWCSGGRNFTAYLTMTRQNTSHGYSDARPVPKLKQRNGNFWSCGQGFARGDTKTIQLPWEVASWLIEGASNNLEMWAGSSHNDYSFYDNVSIRITCEKNFV